MVENPEAEPATTAPANVKDAQEKFLLHSKVTIREMYKL